MSTCGPATPATATGAAPLLDEVHGVDGVEVDTLVGDMAYSDGDVREAVEEAGAEMVAKVPPTTNQGRFPKTDFTVNTRAGSVTCPAGHTTFDARPTKDHKRVPEVLVVHAGNRIDGPDRARARFPSDRELAVADRLGELLDVLAPEGVVTSAAAGADLLMVEAAEKRHVPVHLVLPFPRARFRAVSVEDQGRRWVSAFEHAVERADRRARSSSSTLNPTSTGSWPATRRCSITRPRWPAPDCSWSPSVPRAVKSRRA